MAIQVYDPRKITMTFDNRVVTGFSDSTMFTLESDEEDNLPYDGTQGEHSVARNASNNFTLTVSLASTSPWVSIFRDYARRDDMVKPLSITNMNTGQQDVSTSQAYVKQAPSYTAGKEIETVEVELTVIDPTFA